MARAEPALRYEHLPDSLALRSFGMRSVAVPTLVRIVLRFAIVASLTAWSWAQRDAGSIVGTVRDPSGTVVARASRLVT